MTDPFEYPSAPHIRRHGPQGYADYASYRSWLRDEFSFRCVYCLQREQWGQTRATFDIDHLFPVSLHPNRGVHYHDLLYSCSSCNSGKRDRLSPNPESALIRDAVRVHQDGTIEPLTPEAARIVEVLGLDSTQSTEIRLLWIGIIAMAKQYKPELYEGLMGFPDDLPDLSRLQPPDGNSRPNGVEESHFARRQQGTLPATY